MSQLTQRILLLLVVSLAQTIAFVNLESVPKKGENEICVLQERRDAAIQGIRDSVQIFIQTFENCGAGQWYRVAHLNMSNSSQQCPPAWREYNTNGVRGCRRPSTSSANCRATFYPTGRQYSRVCGRIIGYQIGGTDAFGHYAAGQGIDSYYVYGVSVTYGAPRNHIWTLAAGITEGGYPVQQYNCPCRNLSHPNSAFPPSFVGNNYYCESGNPTDTYGFNHLYYTDVLWDGQQCEGECCSNGKSPPWFSVELANPITDDIEVRICIPQGNIDDVTIQLLELYVQ